MNLELKCSGRLIRARRMISCMFALNVADTLLTVESEA